VNIRLSCFRKRKLSANSVGQHLAALRFFYIKTLRRAWSLANTPYPKKTHSLPTILSREEVAQLIHAARTPCERILLITLYATGVRRSELTHLKISDIDSQRVVEHLAVPQQLSQGCPRVATMLRSTRFAAS
jgi:integrase/recombinase XerD